MVLDFEEHFVDKILNGSKRHTIRKDEHRRWELGEKIHFTTSAQNPKSNQFAWGVCEGVDVVELYPKTREIYLERKGEMKLLGSWLTEVLIENEGFDSEDDFWEWFDKPLKGVLIHWTETLYVVSLDFVVPYRCMYEES